MRNASFSFYLLLFFWVSNSGSLFCRARKNENIEIPSHNLRRNWVGRCITNEWGLRLAKQYSTKKWNKMQRKVASLMMKEERRTPCPLRVFLIKQKIKSKATFFLYDAHMTKLAWSRYESSGTVGMRFRNMYLDGLWGYRVTYLLILIIYTIAASPVSGRHELN